MQREYREFYLCYFEKDHLFVLKACTGQSDFLISRHERPSLTIGRELNRHFPAIQVGIYAEG